MQGECKGHAKILEWFLGAILELFEAVSELARKLGADHKQNQRSPKNTENRKISDRPLPRHTSFLVRQHGGAQASSKTLKHKIADF